jgi:hypothetical protein
MKAFILTLSIISIQILFAQKGTAYEQQRFCKNLNKVFEDGRKENFEAITGMNEKQSPLLPVPGYSINMDPFGTIYVDKDSRFVGKTNENLDSLGALEKLEEYRLFVSTCLDTTWKWSETMGDDSSTVFFKEFKEMRAITRDLNLALAMDVVAPKLYTVNLYVRRNKRGR